MKHSLKKEKDFYVINLEHDEMEIERAFTKEYANIAKKLKLNGFRPGKVPVAIAKNIIKIDDIKEKVLNNFIKEEIDLLSIEEEKYNEVEVEIKNFEYKKELISEVKYYFYPSMKFKDDNYLENIQTIELKKLESEMSEEEINKVIKEIQIEHTEYTEVEEIKTNNVYLTGNFKIFDLEKNETIFEEADYAFIINESNANKILESNLLKSKKNVDHEFEVHYSEDYEIESLKSKKIRYNVLITKIQEGEIPVVNDDFIISILEIEDSEKIEDINSFFREKIKEDFFARKEHEVERFNYETIIDFFIAKAEFDISDYVLKTEKEKIFKGFLTKNELDESMSVEDFSKLIEKTLEETENDFDEIAKNKIMSYLILNEINKKEKIYEEDEEEKGIEDLIQNIGDGISDSDILSLFEKINDISQNDKNDFSISKENINKTIKFLIDKINQESNIMS